MKISCPSKTFLVGEYAVLYGGPAILLATPPYFVFEDNQFSDPLNGIGGFGASGAQFVLKSLSEDPTQTALELFKKYHEEHLSGSGADIICQYVGGISFFNPAEKDAQKIETLDWPFPELWIFLIHTGFKTPTHLHIHQLSESHQASQFEPLKKMVINTYHSIKKYDEKDFINHINNVRLELENLKLTCTSTRQLLSKIIQHPDVLAAKGCGALGSDVILAVTNAKNKEHFTSWALKENLNIIFQGNQFAKGVEIIP